VKLSPSTLLAGLSMLTIVATAHVARAEESAAASGDVAVGAGTFDSHVYAATDVRLDTSWNSLAVGFGARFESIDGHWRSTDFQQRRDVVRLLRYATWRYAWRTSAVAFAAGNLAPTSTALVAENYRASIDLRRRVGIAGQMQSKSFAASAMIDDVLSPVVVTGQVAFDVAPHWRVALASASDLDHADSSLRTVLAASVHRSMSVEKLTVDVGGGITVDLARGAAVVVSAEATMPIRGWTIAAAVDVRAGQGSAGTSFGPLYRLERQDSGQRMSLWSLSKDGRLDGVGAGAAVTLRTAVGSWASLAFRHRAGLGNLATVALGLPMGSRWQAGGWIAKSETAVAGAGEIRVRCTPRWWIAAEVAKAYGVSETAASMPMQSSSAYAALWAGASL
jgi:hypothetical protein